MTAIRIVDVTDEPSFRLIPPCADPGFDHRSCDYWEDADRGSKAARLAWLEASAPTTDRPALDANPFAPARDASPFNPFAPTGASSRPAFNPFGDDDDDDGPTDNPFAPPPPNRPTFGRDVPRKLALLGRGLGIFGSYAKVLLVDDVPAVYAQFGPLSAFPRAQRLRELYAQLPDAPLPAVITCIATTTEARGAGHATRLVGVICDDLAGRGFAAVEAYPERGTRPDATSAATPEFWLAAGFSLAVEDERYPVVRRDLG
jgi:hypothetical protein